MTPDRLDFKPVMAFCLGVLGWPPESFWNATLYDIEAAVTGWQKRHGSFLASYPDQNFMAEMMKKFPD